MSSSPPGPHTGSYSLLQHTGPASSKRSDRRGEAGPALGQSWHPVIQSPEVSQQSSVPRVLERIVVLCCLVLSVAVPKCVCVLVDCDLRTLLVSFADCSSSVDGPGRCRVSAPAERHMIYFRGTDVGIQRGHIYSPLVW